MERENQAITEENRSNSVDAEPAETADTKPNIDDAADRSAEANAIDETSLNPEGKETEQPAEQEPKEQRLLKELEEQRKTAEEYYQRYLRSQADFDNYRKRTLKEKEELVQYASMKLVGELLPVLDNFERAIASSKENKDFDALAKGVDMIFRQFEQVLAREGLKPIEAVGRPFDPEFHQAIMQVESEDHEEGTVVEEVQKGYMLKDKVLRPAMVKVST